VIDARSLANFIRTRLDEDAALVEAKRRTLERHWPRGYPDPRQGDTLRALALAYASHPDYDESWRPKD
jgi:hypothetical protein